ncbi:MAG: hypothetical protein MJE12_27570 [Alphaproteobacteria bacterium]|nr:hypothetical protein [Alphaproteobacteria bacterium]
MGAAAAALMFGAAAANEFEGPIKSLANSQIKGWIQDPMIVSAVKAQNQKHASLSKADIMRLDKQWRSEVGGGNQPLISKIMSNALSNFLKQKAEASQGLFSEIFVMDSKGLNVGQSAVTSDYWQGDEAKWKKTYLAGASAMHIGSVKKDESTQAFQSQLSLPVVDPADNSVIGAITIGINVEQLGQ